MKIICSDNISWLKQQQDNSIDLIITSPPYNLQNKGGNLRLCLIKMIMKTKNMRKGAN